MTALTSMMVRTVISEWSQAGVAPKTIRQRLWSLKHLYKLLRGPDAETPCDHIAPPALARRIIVPTPAALVLAVYKNLLAMEAAGKHRPVEGLSILRDAKTRARFMVRASTGRRPCEIMRAEPGDVDLE